MPKIRRNIQAGDRVTLELPFSEVCMHFRLAGKVAEVEFLQGRYELVAQVHYQGRPFSSPITAGEAGAYCTSGGQWYVYEERKEEEGLWQAEGPVVPKEAAEVLALRLVS